MKEGEGNECFKNICLFLHLMQAILDRRVKRTRGREEKHTYLNNLYVSNKFTIDL